MIRYVLTRATSRFDPDAKILILRSSIHHDDDLLSDADAILLMRWSRDMLMPLSSCCRRVPYPQR